MSNKNLLYIAFKDFSNMHFGANTKVLSQCKAFEDYGYKVDLIGRIGVDTVLIHTDNTKVLLRKNSNSVKDKRIKNYFAKRNQYKAVTAYLADKCYDVCYIRYDFSDRAFLSALKVIKKHCQKIFLELPTYPYEKENNIGLLNKVKLKIDFHYRKKLLKYVDKIVTFYDGHEELFGIPVLVIPNGFDFSTMSLVKSELSTDDIHLIAVSSMREWHGYERMIEGIHMYYQQEKHPDNFILHLVGDGREYDKYKNLVERYHLENHVIMEGAMFGDELDRLYEKCVIGVDSLARHRSGITVLSSLKSREYGAKGIAIINSCKIDIITDDFPYLLMVPGNETAIDMNQVADFYVRCYKSGKTRTDVAKEIRDYISDKCSMKATLSRVVREFE